MLGDKIKAFRLSQKMTLDELSTKLNNQYPNTVNFNKGKLSKWENGKEEPKLSSMRILADFYNVSIEDFYVDKPTISTIYNQLESDRKKEVYEFAENQLRDQNAKNIFTYKPESEESCAAEEGSIYTIAAHSDDPHRKVNEEELKEINNFLDELDAKYDAKNNKNK